MTLDLYQIMIEEVGNGSNNLVTRETGKTVRERIEKEIEEQRAKGKVQRVTYLDFSRVGIIDYSCADEVIAKLVSRLLGGEYGDRYIVLTGLNLNQEENIQVALERKKLAILKNLRFKVQHSKETLHRDQGLDIIGFLTPHLREAFNIVNQRGSLTAKELAETLNIELNTASTRLINLYKKRLITRIEKVMSEGGREFVYGRVGEKEYRGEKSGNDN